MGELIGFIDLGDEELNYSCFHDIKQLATHSLVYYVRGLASDLKFSLAYFSTKGVTSYQIMTTFWEAVAVLELTCELPVITTVSDGHHQIGNLLKYTKCWLGKKTLMLFIVQSTCLLQIGFYGSLRMLHT